MVELLLKRYLWLIDTLKRNGEMTFDEIAKRWEDSSLNPHHVREAMDVWRMQGDGKFRWTPDMENYEKMMRKK